MKKLFVAVMMSFMVFMSTSVSAHVVVNPGEVKTGARTTFAVSVPNEHDTPVVEVRVIIPEGLESIKPYAKTGWSIRMVKSGEGDSAKVTEIIWSGGQVPVELKDDFLFGAKAPGNETELQWKAYETYENGLVVSWDQPPSEAEDSKPYSITKVVSGESAPETVSQRQSANGTDKTTRTISILALVISLLGFALSSSKQKQKQCLASNSC